MKKHKLFLSLVLFTLNLFGAWRVYALEDNDSVIFTVSIPEEIIVTVTNAKTGASGVAGNFLRNVVSVEVASNNPYGFLSTLKSKTSVTDLVNQFDNSVTIPTLSASTTQANFGNNRWGYSTDDSTVISSTSTYNPILESGATLNDISASSAASLSDDIYFAMKADGSKLSGTYSGTVVIMVVGKTSNGNTETDPTPDGDSEETQVDDNTTIITQDYDDGTTQKTTITTSEDDTTKTTETAKSSYATPQGAKETTLSRTKKVWNAVAWAVAIVSTTGLVIVILTSRREVEEEPEE